MKYYYLDHAATTPLDPRVLEHMMPYMNDLFGNPSSMHQKGIEVKRDINIARESIANLFDIEPDGVIFTSGGTEATNLAIRGTALMNKEKHTIITTRIEHHATLNTVHKLEKEGYKIVYLNVDHEGFIDLVELEKTITNDTLMLSIILGNNEIGTLQNIEMIGKICQRNNILLHVDAVQMVQYKKLSMRDLSIDLLTLSAHKFYGPKGIGALLVKNRSILEPIIYGGHQEKGLRSGTENVYGIVGMAKALLLAHQERKVRVTHLQKLTQTLMTQMKQAIPDVVYNGPKEDSYRIPGLLSLSFPDVDGQALLFSLNQRGIYVSTGSACQANEATSSHVLRAIHMDRGYGTIRISFGQDNNVDDIDDIVAIFKSVYEDI
ncbi:MAG: cysteine desulfurase family protein [Acholeplasmataceae bacterium]